MRGLLKTEISTIILGAGLSALVLFSGIFVILALFLLHRTRRDGDGEGCFFPPVFASRTSTTLTIRRSGTTFLPGISLSERLELQFGSRRWIYEIPYSRYGVGQETILLPPRGTWSVHSALRVRDPFGFYSLDLFRDRTQNVVSLVVPRDIEQRIIAGKAELSEASALRRKEDADERLERRDYLPGDDPRHLDWKHYARTGGLLIRTGEEPIPFRSRVWIQILGDGQSSSPMPERFDEVLVAAMSLVQSLLDEHREVLLGLPGETSWIDVAASDTWKNSLASARSDWSRRLPSPGAGESLVVFCDPANSQWPLVLNQILDEGVSVLSAWPRIDEYPRPSFLRRNQEPSLKLHWRRRIFQKDLAEAIGYAEERGVHVLVL